MKKKILILALIALTVLALSACDDTKKNDGASSNTTTASTTTSAKSKKGETSCGEKYLDTNKTYSVVFSTSKGDYTVTLDPKQAPIGSAHLAALVKAKFYDGLTYHRIIKGFVIQGGDPKGDGSGGPDCSVVTEAPGRAYKPGDFAWAKTSNAPNGSAGSQFFIVTGPDAASALTDQYGYAGLVTSGMDVVTAIENSPTGPGDAPLETVKINSATLTES